MEEAEETLVLNYIDEDLATITIERAGPPSSSLGYSGEDYKFDENLNSKVACAKFFPNSVLAKPKELDDIPDDEDEDIPKELIVILEKEVLRPTSKPIINNLSKNIDGHQFATPNLPKNKKGWPPKSLGQETPKNNGIFPHTPPPINRLKSVPLDSRNNFSHPSTNDFQAIVKIEPSDESDIVSRTLVGNRTQNVTTDIEEAIVKYETDVEQACMHTEFKYESQSENEEAIRRREALYVASFSNTLKKKKSRIGIEEQLIVGNFVKVSEPKRRKTKGQIKAPGLTIFKCKHCLYVGKSRANLQRHNMLHTDPSKIVWFKCAHCPYQSKYGFQLKSHMILHKNPDEIEYQQCPYCDHKCARKHNLIQHIRSIHSNLENSFKCAICPYSTISKDRLVSHMKSHSTEVFTCKLCKFVTKTQTYLNNHIKYIHGTIIKPFMCDTCSYRSKTGRELERHYMRMHNKDQLQSYQCHLCLFKSIYKKNLDYHVLHMHRNSEGCSKFICGHCNKEFTYKSGLKVHIVRKHLILPEDQWHKCKECKYKSKCLTTLKRHIKRSHGEPRLHCDWCSFATNRLRSMKAHVDTHRGGEIYKCSRCPYRITQSQSFVYHMKTSHGLFVSAKDIGQYCIKAKVEMKDTIF